MQSQSKLKRHAALVDQMATAQGLDLEEQMFRGNLSFFELEEAVLRCTGCSSPDTCSTHLATLNGAQADLPSYCRNGDLFNALRDG